MLAAVALAGCRPVDTRPKKLIEFGWDEPDTAFLRRHIGEMERTPFDGCVFRVTYRRADDQEGNFTWEAWGDRRIGEAELRPALDDLKATERRRFTELFLRVNATPGNVDWFSDFSPILHNARLAARLARDGGCRGIFLDVEQYRQPLFDYRRQVGAPSKSWEAYAAQARRRGQEMMTAFRNGFPAVTILLSFGYSMPWLESQSGAKRLSECRYGLLAPFLDGLLAAAEEGRLVDGFEHSYGYKNRGRFAYGYQVMKDGVLPIVLDAERYRRSMSFGFGIWLDYGGRARGWNAERTNLNYFTPAAFEAAVAAALERSDRYVWIYSETPRWWSESGPQGLPAAYQDALSKAARTRNGPG